MPQLAVVPILPHPHLPLDYFMDLISVDRRLPELETKTKRRIEFLADKYNQTLGAKPPAIEAPPAGSEESLSDTTDKYAASWWTQFTLLAKRDLLRTIRERKTNIIAIVQAIMFALLISVIWLREGDGANGRAIQNVGGVLFFICRVGEGGWSVCEVFLPTSKPCSN